MIKHTTGQKTLVTLSLVHIYGLMNSAMCLFQMDLPPWQCQMDFVCHWHTKSIWRHLTHVTNLHSITSWLCRQPDHWSLTRYALCLSSSSFFCTKSKEWYLGQNQTGHSIPGGHQQQVHDTHIRDGLYIRLYIIWSFIWRRWVARQVQLCKE